MNGSVKFGIYLIATLLCYHINTVTSLQLANNGSMEQQNMTTTIATNSWTTFIPEMTSTQKDTTTNESENATAILTSSSSTFSPDLTSTLQTTESTFPGNNSNETTNPPTLQNNPLAKYWTFRAAVQLYLVWPIVFFTLGLIGNVLSFIVFVQPVLRRYPSYTYLTVLAVFDQLALTAVMIQMFGETRTEPHIISPAFCKITAFCKSFFTHFAVWCIVLFTIERFIVVAFPLKAVILCTRKRAIIAMSVVFLFCLGLNTHLFWSVHITPPAFPPGCYPNQEFAAFLSIWTWIDSAFYSIVHTISLFILNIIVAVLMFTAGRRQRNLTHTQGQETRGIHSKQITATLFAVSIFFLVCTLPGVVLFLYRYTFWQKRFPTHPDEQALFVFINQILSMLFISNHTFNVVLYSLTGRRFRTEVKRMFICGPRKLAKQITMITGSSSRSRKSSNSSAKVPPSMIMKSSNPQTNAKELEESLRRTSVTLDTNGIDNKAFTKL